MVATPLIAVVIITNGRSSNLVNVAQRWISEGFVPGKTLFFCGPKAPLIELDLDAKGIIDYVDPPHYSNNFHINHKKRSACDAIEAEYIYLIHDRFIPSTGILETLNNLLEKRDVDFGALDVNNEDGTPALRELRLCRNAASKDVCTALETVGRLVCTAEDAHASDHVAVNGGQFFLRKSMSKHLARPLRWVEMEDDVLSHDLRAANGLWIGETGLITLVPRNAPVVSQKNMRKYLLYRLACNILAALTGSVSSGKAIDHIKLERLLSDKFLLIDPLHKATSSVFLPSSLEKLSTRARLASDGKAWTNVQKHIFGWRVTGYKGEV